MVLGLPKGPAVLSLLPSRMLREAERVDGDILKAKASCCTEG